MENIWELEQEDLPAKEDIKYIMDFLKSKTKEWLFEIDFNAENENFEWTGKTMGSVILFLIRHSQYHLGEINSLLNEYQRGSTEDYFANTL